MKKVTTSESKTSAGRNTKATTKPKLVALEVLPSLHSAASNNTAANKSPEDWAHRINTRVGAGIEAFIKAGLDLKAAKQALGHGGFGALFVSGLLRIDQRAAQMLMRIAEHSVLANPNNYSLLPHSLHSLDKLAAVEPTLVEKAISTGKITPQMTIADAQKFVKSLCEPCSDRDLPAATSKTKNDPAPSAAPPPMQLNFQRQPFDEAAFKSRVIAFLKEEYAKYSPGYAFGMRKIVAYANSDFFASRILK
jgi:hypothetical protein